MNADVKVMTAVIEIFTSPTCIYCPGAKKTVAEVTKDLKDIRVVEHNSATEEGRKRATEFGIQSVPTIFVSGPKTKEIIGFRGAPSKEGILKAIKTVS